MAVITHPSMGKSNITPEPSNQAAPQSYVVEDMSAFEAPVKPEGDKIVYETKTKSLSDEDRQKIEDILFLGRTSKVVEIAGHKFEISTLTHKEHNLLLKELAKINESSDIFNIRIYTLSSSLRTVDGTKLEDLPTEGEFGSVFEKKLAVLDNMQLKLIERLFLEYTNLLEETDSIITGDNLKKS